MSKPPPVGGFEWSTYFDNWRSTPCILKVDLEYWKELHDDHYKYPLAPRRLMMNGVEKLVPNLYDKERYIVHYKNFLNNILFWVWRSREKSFKENPWLKKHIGLNMNILGIILSSEKTLENIRNCVDVRLVNNHKLAITLTAKPNFKHCTMFDLNLITVHKKKTKLVFKKAVYFRMSILISARVWCMISNTITSNRNKEMVQSFSSQKLTVSAMRSKLKTSSRI